MSDSLAGLARVDLDDEAKELLVKIQAGGESELRKIVSEFLGQEAQVLDLSVVRLLHEKAREAVRLNVCPGALVDQYWLLSRIAEIFLAMEHRPFCVFCYRTVALRRSGQLKKYCPEHASGPESGSSGGYLRGVRFSGEFVEQAKSLEMGLLLDDLEFKFLRHQIHSTRFGAGSASNVVMPERATDSVWTAGTNLTIQDLRLKEICQDYPDWTELALRWRRLFDDKEGALELESQKGAVSPRLLLEQWLRWKLWTIAGDKDARIGKGRPAKIDKVAALEMRADGKTHAEIADKFGVSKVAVAMFFTRLKKKEGLDS